MRLGLSGGEFEYGKSEKEAEESEKGLICNGEIASRKGVSQVE